MHSAMTDHLVCIVLLALPLHTCLSIQPLTPGILRQLKHTNHMRRSTDLSFRTLANVEISSFMTCVPGSKFSTISSFQNFNAETGCDDVSLLDSDTSANGTAGLEIIQIPLSAASPFANRKIKNDHEVNGTIEYGRCQGDNMLCQHISLGEAGSCTGDRKIGRLSTIISVIRIRGRCQSFCSGLTTIRIGPNIK